MSSKPKPGKSVALVPAPIVRRRGKQPKFLPEIRERLLQRLKAGTPVGFACQAAGVAYRTFRNWMQDAELHPGTSQYREFYDEVQKAIGDFVTANLVRIQKAAQEPKNWTASAWLLERLYPDQFGRVTHKIDTDHISAETLKHIYEQMRISLAKHCSAEEIEKIEKDWLSIKIL